MDHGGEEPGRCFRRNSFILNDSILMHAGKTCRVLKLHAKSIAPLKNDVFPSEIVVGVLRGDPIEHGTNPKDGYAEALQDTIFPVSLLRFPPPIGRRFLAGDARPACSGQHCPRPRR